MTDPVVDSLRAQISALDRDVLDAFNRRLELVAELKRYKDELGLSFLDPDRERRMLAELRAANGGPLSDEGVAALLAALLDLTKQEL
jgi:chorismate mutase